ncbi:hypothetical protein MATL_G00104560 [Megalops atlanticus]|uniref:TNFR-Cys domain-containing protein n=1 Tax=Megalops atlanticus TaxID=7932 RepID=A0A9D3Q3N7_MEGAT|nr:hypothetical protein MATL_G00104560 [Megalops atlanticus]
MGNIFKQWIVCILLLLPVYLHACDPETQYEKDGECCKMCGPGTRMSSDANCNDPVCSPCEKNEYQEGYTKEMKCKLQPNCDENLNFEQEPLDRTIKRPCRCKKGFHCAGNGCHKCIKNTECEEGHGVLKMGTQENDTVCEVCPPGTFSNESSAVFRCRPWTKCGPGFVETESGTSTSDVVCAEQTNGSLIAIVVIVIVAAVAVALGLLCAKQESCRAVICKLNNHVNVCKKPNKPDQPLVPDVGPQDVEAPPKDHRPEENEECMEAAEGTAFLGASLPYPIQAAGVTENYNPVRQEESKEDHAPSPETQGTSKMCL